MNRADAIVMCYSDGRPPVRRRDVVRDNQQTMRREFLSVDGQTVTGWVTMDAIEQLRAQPNPRHRPDPWGTYARKPLSTQ